jgi:hypothetical protein
MTCSICRYEWCWLCGAMYTNNHFNEYNPEGCRGKLMPSSIPSDNVDNFDEPQLLLPEMPTNEQEESQSF